MRQQDIHPLSALGTVELTASEMAAIDGGGPGTGTAVDPVLDWLKLILGGGQP
ncbi:MAG TPA: hypothetical protein VFH27_07765 [Longimicrobiaceae bacterium]|nr:hypothetical protein [Longimicrobiaceae bacterium]